MINNIIVRLVDGRTIKMVPEPAAQPQAESQAQPESSAQAQPESDKPQSERKLSFRRGKGNELKVWMPLKECLATAEFLTKDGRWIPVAVWDMTKTGRIFLAFITKEKKKREWKGEEIVDFFAYHNTGKWYCDAEKLRNVKVVE